MRKTKARKPVSTKDRYLKYGFVITERQILTCPRCRSGLSAGPSYTPNYCAHCGQKLTFAGICWEPEKTVGYADLGSVG